MVERADLMVGNERSLMSLGRAIALSSNQFSVVLVCCNYGVLQERMLQRLQELPLRESQIQKIVLPHNVISLYTTIQLQLGDEQPSALMVLGLEDVDALDELLIATNQVRDEFRKLLPFPMVIWVNDLVLQKLVRLAPDFASWAATPIRFEMTTRSLLEFLHRETNSLFATALNSTTKENRGIIYPNSTLGKVREDSYELRSAIKELLGHGIKLHRDLEASLEFVFGLDEYLNDRIDSALNYFHESLKFWQDLSDNEQDQHRRRIHNLLASELEIVNSLGSPQLRSGVLLFHIGLCYCRQAERHQTENRLHREKAKNYFQQCVNLFDSAGRPDIVAQFIGQLAEVLQHLQQWEELLYVAEKSLELHQTYGTHIQLACDYGFLAEVAIEQSDWAKASQFAQQSLFYLREAKNNSDPHQGLFPLLLEQIYQLILAKAQRHLGQVVEQLERASQALPEALESSDHRYDARRYIRYLRKLRSLYFEQGRYIEAFCIRTKRRSVEQQYGFRAFIGAGRLQPQRQVTNPAVMPMAGGGTVALEIVASGRLRDVNHLIGRISRSDQKLTVIHGQSGVGKSSTIAAGLVPALQHTTLGDQIAVPVVVQVYTDWVRRLGESLAEAIAHIQGRATDAVIGSQAPSCPATLNSVEAILRQLSANGNNYLITVLIFDQFEEFFFYCSEPAKRQQFDKFIRDCLNIPFVNVILCLREDYLSRLLEFKHLATLEVIDNNILSKNIRYQLNNFLPADAKTLIEKLTERSQVHLEPTLIDALVEDLAAELGEVRPIELQVLGAQLQDESITKLEQYQPFRSNKLIEQYLRQVIKDSGYENEQAALLVLYLLTDENKNRPFKTRAELAAGLAELEQAEKLELVLEILVRSGLVVLFPGLTDFYQLIHDYLVDLIRNLQQQESGLLTELKQLRHKVEESQVEIKRLESELRQKKQQAKLEDSDRQKGLDLLTQLKELRKREKLSLVEIEQLRAELKEKELTTQLAESKEQQRLSEARVNRSLRIALGISVTAIMGLTASIVIAISLWRQAVISEIRALSSSSEALFASHKGIDALKEGIKTGRKLKKTVLSDSETQRQVGTALYQAVYGVIEHNSLEDHIAGINSVSFSPDRSLIASASADRTIKLWRPDGRLLKTLEGHTDVVNSVSFSYDAKILASASQDKTVKLWSRDGKLLITLNGHAGVVNSVSFSPDGQTIASASTDKTVKIWNRKGRLLRTLLGHGDAVLGVAWSPQGSTIASVSTDKTVKLWSRDGRLLKTLMGHSDAVKSLAWSPNGSAIASASLDKTIKLWSQDGRLLRTLPGHTDGVTSVNFSPDGQIIASASIDGTVKLWRSDGVLQETLKGHNDWVNSVSFSPEGNTLASASRDKTIKLWRWDDLHLRNSIAHALGVTSVSFSPDGHTIASASQDKTVKLWNRNGKLLHTLKGHDGEVWGVGFSPYGKTIASASSDKTVKLWSRDGKLLKTFTGHKGKVLSVSFSPNGQIIASASKDKTVKLWSREGRLLRSLEHQDAVNWVSFSPDGELLASASDDNTVKLWSQDGRLLYTLKNHNRPVYGVAWSPQGSTIASASIDNTVKLWKADGRLLQTLNGYGDGFSSVSFSRDGKIAATSDDKVKIWSQDGTLLITLKGHRDEFSNVSFSPDGKILAIADVKGTVILRNLSDIELDNLLARGCDWLQDYLKNNSQVTNSDRALCRGR